MSGKGCKAYVKEITALGRRIIIAVYETQDGMNILIEGGDRGHIGAVAVAKGGYIIESVSFPSHREDVIARNWAEKLSALYPGPVVVEAGIHYDGITKEQIREVLKTLEEEQKEFIKLRNWKQQKNEPQERICMRVAAENVSEKEQGKSNGKYSYYK